MTSVRQALSAAVLAVVLVGTAPMIASDDAAPPGPMSWTRLGRVFGAGTVVDLTTLPDGGVLAGGAHGYPSARVWHSADGVDWKEIPLPGRDHSMVRSVAAADGHILAVGTRSTGQRPEGVAWTSRDGLEWSERKDFEGALPVDAIATSDGYAVVRTGHPQDGPQPITVGHSADGVDWESFRVSDDHFVGASAVVERTADGAWVLAAAEMDKPARLWRSDDGKAWEPTAEVASAGWRLGTLVAAPTGFLFVNPRTQAGDYLGSSIWHSVDGREWTEVTTLEESITAMSAGPTGVLALTTPPDRHAYEGDYPVALLMSNDGSSWTTIEVPEFEGKPFKRLAALPDGQILAIRRLNDITWLGRPSNAPSVILPEPTPDPRAELLDFKALVKSGDHPEGEFDEVGYDIVAYFETEGDDLDPLHLASPPIGDLVQDCKRFMRKDDDRFWCVPVFLRLHQAHGLSRDPLPYELADRWLGVTMDGDRSYRKALIERIKWNRVAYPDWFKG